MRDSATEDGERSNHRHPAADAAHVWFLGQLFKSYMSADGPKSCRYVVANSDDGKWAGCRLESAE